MCSNSLVHAYLILLSIKEVKGYEVASACVVLTLEFMAPPINNYHVHVGMHKCMLDSWQAASVCSKAVCCAF